MWKRLFLADVPRQYSSAQPTVSTGALGFSSRIFLTVLYMTSQFGGVLDFPAAPILRAGVLRDLVPFPLLSAVFCRFTAGPTSKLISSRSTVVTNEGELSLSAPRDFFSTGSRYAKPASSCGFALRDVELRVVRREGDCACA